MRSLERLCWAPWLVALLLVPVAMGLIGMHPNDVRIEDLNEAPRFDAGRLLDENYYREIDDYVANEFPARGIGVWAQAQVDYRLFRDLGRDDVVLGPGHWLHRTDNVHPDCAGLATLGRPIIDDTLVDQVAFAILAPKNDIHPESDPEGDIADCVLEERRRWKQRAASRPDHVDVNTALAAEVAETGELMFHERDSHWTPAARVRAAEALVEHWSPGLWDDAAVRPTPESEREMDLLRQVGIRRTEVYIDRAVERDGDVEVEEVRAVESMGVYFPLSQISRSSAADVIPGTTLVVGDSQIGYLLLELAPYFEELVFMNWLQLVIEPAVADGLPSPDRVVFAGVEANAPGLFANPFVAATVESLP